MLGRSITFYTIVASPALSYLSMERSTANGDAIALDSFWLRVVVIARSDSAERATADGYRAFAVEPLATVTAAGHGESTARHGERMVALDASGATVIRFRRIIDIIACGVDSDVTTAYHYYGVAFDTSSGLA